MDLNIDLATKGQVVGRGQLNAFKNVCLERNMDNAITLVDTLDKFSNLHQLFNLSFYKSLSMTKLVEIIGLLKIFDFFGAVRKCGSFLTPSNNLKCL